MAVPVAQDSGEDTAPREHAHTRAPFLLVESPRSPWASAEPILSTLASVVGATSVASALEALASRAVWSGLVVYADISGGHGLKVVEAARTRHHFAPTLLIVRTPEAWLVNRADELRARLVCEPIREETIAHFAVTALRGAAARRAFVARVIQLWTARYDLTDQEARILRLRVDGRTREELPGLLRVRPATVRSHTRNLLAKTQLPNLPAVIEAVLREALVLAL